MFSFVKCSWGFKYVLLVKGMKADQYYKNKQCNKNR